MRQTPVTFINISFFLYTISYHLYTVLLKKYIKQNAHLVGFNVDPKFNNAVDGLLYIRIADLPESTVKPVLEEFQAELERKLHQEKNET